MQIANCKTTAVAIAIFLMLSMTASTILIPKASAATPLSIPTYAYINASPNPVGTGQSVEIIMWLNQVIFAASATNNIRFKNYMLSITAPDGKTTTIPFATVSDSTSAQDYYYTPTAVGKYVLNFTFPGQVYNWPLAYTLFGVPNTAYEGATYEAASTSMDLTVQSTPILPLPATPLPTAYWTRPIYGENTNWYSISSNWLGCFAPGYTGFLGTYNEGGNGEQLNGANDVVGSLTSHVMWTKLLESGGVVGGNQTVIQGDTYFEGSAYNERFANPIIVDGILVYSEPISFAGSSVSLTGSAYGPTVAVDLRTGQQLWSNPNMPQISFASIYDVQDANQHGVYPPILISSTGGVTLTPTGTIGLPENWKAYDAFTGDYMFSENDVPFGVGTSPVGLGSSTTVLGPEGEYLIISLANLGNSTNPNWYLQEWNSSRLWGTTYFTDGFAPSEVPPVSSANEVTAGWTGGMIAGSYVPSTYDYNVSVPFLDSSYGMAPVTVVGAIRGDLLLAYSGNLPSTGTDFMGVQSDTPYTYFTLNINQGTPSSLGTAIWHQTETPPSGNITVLEAGIDPVNRVFVENYRETQQFVGYSLDTGQHLWGPTTPQVDIDYYGSPASGSLANTFAYGKMYSSAYGGIVYCYDTKTGGILWTYGNGGEGNSTNSGVETPFGHYPTFVQAIGSDAVYLVTTEHTPETPIFKGATASAINATTGKLIWQISDYTGEFEYMSYAAADGYNTWFNGYDDQIYVVGRGPSDTTVSVPHAGLAYGQSLVISGTVMDISAGTKQVEQAADFPCGVPCASDASMTQWMGYVYQQQPEPTNFTGVKVAISVLDSNGNCYKIGTATTDSSGNYRLTWTPIIPGNYTVYANFEGTNGCWPSSAEDGFTVMPAAPTLPPTAPPVTGLASTGTVELGIAAVIIVIVIIGVILAILTMRKHP